MSATKKLVLVLGATGQQGGATARALLAAGFKVRALVRSPESEKARALAAAGAEIVAGDLRDRASLERAATGAYGVFSIQPSSGQPQYGVTDADELAFGTSVADVAKGAGVQHFVYTSMAGLKPGTGIGHFESKWQIEQHVKASGLAATLVRPGAFMELLLEPHFGLARGELVFFLRPERTMQFIASEDIGVLVAKVFASPERHVGQTLELAGDELSGLQLAEKLGAAIGKPIRYSRFPDSVLAQSPLLARLAEVVDQEVAVGNADIPALRQLHPKLLTLDGWLEQGGAAALRAAL